MSGLELVKTLTPKESRIDELAPESAVEIIRSQETKLKAAAKKRIAKPDSSKDVINDFTTRQANKLTFIQVIAGASTMIFGGPVNDSFEVVIVGAIMTISTPVTYAIGASFLERSKSIQNLFPSLKRKIQENEAERRLWEMKEKEYRKVEKKSYGKLNQR